MILSGNQKWVWFAATAAYSAGHVYPRMAACEAALESGYGQSELAKIGNNLFGLKQHVHPSYGTVALPTKEFLDGEWKEVEANFVRYPMQSDCFADRMATLIRLRDCYPHYDAALRAPDPETYIQEVSKSWSTDPARATKVLELYREYFPSPASPPENSPTPK